MSMNYCLFPMTGMWAPLKEKFWSVLFISPKVPKLCLTHYRDSINIHWINEKYKTILSAPLLPKLYPTPQRHLIFFSLSSLLFLKITNICKDRNNGTVNPVNPAFIIITFGQSCFSLSFYVLRVRGIGTNIF